MKGEILSIETTQYIQELKNTIESQSDIIQELQERIDKAIEYIIDELLDGNIERHRKYYMDISGSDLPSDCIVKIVDILEGKDE